MIDEPVSIGGIPTANRRRVALCWAAFFVFVFLNFAFVDLWSGRARGLRAQLVALSVDQIEEGADGLTSVVVFDRTGNRISLLRGKGKWLAEDILITGLQVSIPRRHLDRMNRVKMRVGERIFEFSSSQFRTDWHEVPGDSSVATFLPPAAVWPERSSLPFLGNVLNWSGDSRIIREVCLSSAWKFGLCVLLVLASLAFVPFMGLGRLLPPGREPSSRAILLLCIIFGLSYATAFLITARFHNTVDPGGDAWEYQSMAVNAAKGHGFNRIGGIEPFETYKLQNAEKDTIDYPPLMSKVGGTFWAYRTPGYSAFLAGLYAVVGVSPASAKEAQLLLLVLVAAFLPYAGYRYWKSSGFYGGIVAGILFLARWAFIAERIYTECLIVFTIFVFILAMMSYEHRRTVPSILLLGLIAGVALLVKGDLVFLPPMTFILLGYQAFKKRIPLSHPFLFAILCVAVVSPWSAYASRQSGQFVVLSTQGSEVLLDGNNEGVWEDGAWHPEYRRRPIPTAFYNREDIRSLPPLQKIFRFYGTYPEKLAVALPLKLTAGFGTYAYLRIAVLMILIVLVGILKADAGREPTGRGRTRTYRVASVVLSGTILVLAVFNIPVMCLVLCCVIGVAASRHKLFRFSFPPSFVILFLDFVLITLVAFGDPRFILVIDFLFMLTAMTYIFSFLQHRGLRYNLIDSGVNVPAVVQ